MFGWFKTLSLLGKTAVVVGSVATVSTAGAIVSPDKTNQNQQQAQPQAKVEVKTEKVTETIPCKSIEKKDSSLAKGKKVIVQHCKNGAKILAYKVTYTDGAETSRQELSSKIKTNAVSRITKIGTYVAPEPEPEPEPAPSNCNPNYSPCVPNSAYDLDCADIGFSVTVTGYDVYRFDADGDGIGCESY